LSEELRPNAPTSSIWRPSLIVFIAWVAIELVLQWLQTGGRAAQMADLVRGGPVWGVIAAAVFVVAAITYLKWWTAVGAVRPQNAGLLWPPVLVLMVYMGIALRVGLPSWPIVVIVALNTAFVGVSEELMFRGIALNATVRRYGVREGVLIAAALFGSLHVLNAITTHQLSIAIGQALVASLFGIWAGALRVRTGSVLPLIAIHWLWDGLLILAGGPAALFALPAAIGLGAWGLWLLQDYRAVAADTADAAHVADGADGADTSRP